LPTGEKLVVVIFTVGQATNKELIPAVAKQLIQEVTTKR
jgi:hypothetical protein